MIRVNFIAQLYTNALYTFQILFFFFHSTLLSLCLTIFPLLSIFFCLIQSDSKLCLWHGCRYSPFVNIGYIPRVINCSRCINPTKWRRDKKKWNIAKMENNFCWRGNKIDILLYWDVYLMIEEGRVASPNSNNRNCDGLSAMKCVMRMHYTKDVFISFSLYLAMCLPIDDHYHSIFLVVVRFRY